MILKIYCWYFMLVLASFAEYLCSYNPHKVLNDRWLAILKKTKDCNNNLRDFFIYVVASITHHGKKKKGQSTPLTPRKLAMKAEIHRLRMAVIRLKRKVRVLESKSAEPKKVYMLSVCDVSFWIEQTFSLKKLKDKNLCL